MYRAKHAAVSVLIVMSFMVAGALTRSPAQSTETQSTSPDNTRMSRCSGPRDVIAYRLHCRSTERQTDPDRKITQQIRESLVKDKSLSTDGHNVKVVTQNGQVTLKGPVRSDDEKKTIEAKATEIAGENKVTSELNIKPQQ